MPRQSNRAMLADADGLRYFARGADFLALLSATIYLHAFLSRGLITSNGAVAPTSGLVVTATLIASAVGLLMAWRHEARGGAVALIAGLALGALVYGTADHNAFLTAFVYASPFVITGALFLLYAWLSRRRPAPRR